MREKSLMPLNNAGNSSTSLFIEEESQSKSDTWEERNVSDGDLVSSEVRSFLELGLNDFEDSQVILFSSFISFFGNGPEAESAVEDSGMVGRELGVVELQPLIDGCGLCWGVSVELSSFSGQVSEDGVGFVDAAFWGFKGGDLPEGVLLKVFSRFDLVEGDSLNFDGDIDELGEDLNFGAGSDLVLGRVKLVAHC